jgi:hypothetical protein
VSPPTTQAPSRRPGGGATQIGGRGLNDVNWIREHLSYANVVATLALFIALGGSSYAVSKISGSQLKNNSVAGKKLKRNTLGGKRIKESRLGTVPSARNAARVGGLTAEQLLLRCPEGTLGVADVCIETQPRPATTYRGARGDCGAVDGPPRAGRRVPTYGELAQALTFDQIQLAPGGELTSEVYPSGSRPGSVDVLYISEEVGSVGLVPDGPGGEKAFRCMADPLN